MEKQRLRATGLVAAGVMAGGILAGTLGAQAADDADGPAMTAPAAVGRAHHPGPMDPGGPRGGEDLAKALGVSQDDLREAFEAIRGDVRPSDRPSGPPTAALAKELGISEAKVKAAFQQVHKAHKAVRREALGDRLDDAVDDGTLTKRDKASVLKAFDAGVLGGPGRPAPR